LKISPKSQKEQNKIIFQKFVVFLVGAGFAQDEIFSLCFSIISVRRFSIAWVSLIYVPLNLSAFRSMSVVSSTSFVFISISKISIKSQICILISLSK